MSGYEYVDGDGDKVKFERQSPDSVVYMTAEGNDSDSDPVIVSVLPSEFPEFLAGIAKTMGLRAVFYHVEDIPEFMPDRTVGNVTFSIDRTGTQVTVRRGSRGTFAAMLEGWEEAHHAGAILMAMGDMLKAKLDKKTEEKARRSKLETDLAEAIMRGDLTRITRGQALRAAREVLGQGWTVIPPYPGLPVEDDEEL
jgi:hypothetical protein